MLKKSDKSAKKIKTSKIRMNKMQSPKLNIYNIGVYFPDRDLLMFEVTAHGFNIDKGTAYFYFTTEDGAREFVGSFTHIAYILIKEIYGIREEPKELPANFGQLL